MSAMASQINGVHIVYSTVCSETYQGKHQSSASLAFVRGIHRWPVNSSHKGPVTRKMCPFDDVITEAATKTTSIRGHNIKYFFDASYSSNKCSETYHQRWRSRLVYSKHGAIFYCGLLLYILYTSGCTLQDIVDSWIHFELHSTNSSHLTPNAFVLIMV